MFEVPATCASYKSITKGSTRVTSAPGAGYLLPSGRRLAFVRDSAVRFHRNGQCRARTGRKRRNTLRALLLATLTQFSSQAASAWERMIENDIAVYYIDPATAARSGSKVRIWTLSDNKPALVSAPPESRSTRIHWEIDCVARRLRVLVNASYAQPMGAGPVAFASSGPPGGYPWLSPKPGDVNERIIQTACARKQQSG